MKQLFTILFFFIASATYAQSSSINYKAVVKDNTGAVVTNQTITVQLSILKGVAQTNVYQETHTPTTDVNGLIIVNIGEGATSDDFSTIDWSSDDHFLNVQINTGSGLTDMGTTQFMAVPYALSAANVTGLEKITENANNGWRLKGANPANYDNIGVNAVDLSISMISSGVYGASGHASTALGVSVTASGSYATAMGVNTTASGNYATSKGVNTEASGDYSTAMGNNTEASGIASTAMGASTIASGNYATTMGNYTRASGYNSTAIGRYNVGGGNPTTWMNSDPLFEIGNGISNASKSNALTVLKDGSIMAPSLSLGLITDNKSLITKEYADTNLVSSGLESIDEGNGIGWRLKDEDIANHGNTGFLALNLSNNNFASATHGATGSRSTALGFATTASGDYSTAMGSRTIASGQTSTAMGSYTVASSFYSTAMGLQTLASGNSATAMGHYTTASGLYSMSGGHETKAESSYSTAIGRFNIGGGNPSSWNNADPIFEIGNGTSSASRKNAFTILKNGKVGIGEHQPSGFLEVKASNSGSSPNINLIHSGSTGARINFSNTVTTNGNVWTLYGDSDDIDSDSVFNIYHPNAGNIVQVRGDGHVGINGAPDTEFHITHGASGANDGLKLQNSGANANWWRFYTVNATGSLELFSKSQGVTPVGNFNGVSGAYTSTSDRRLKKNFKDLHFNWEDFMKLKTLTYQYKVQKETKEHIGLVAQDVAPIYPELVEYNQEEDVYHMNYSGFGVVAIKAVQEQQKIIDGQASRIEQLEAKLSENETRMNQIEALLNIK